MRRITLMGFAIVVGVSAAIAADDPIKARQALMDKNGDSIKPIVPILKGQAPFDLATVQTALNAFIATSEQAPPLFAPGTDKGKTKALPAIWQNKADFDARMAKLGSDSRAALASIMDEASFKAKFPPILKNCGDCHETYRAKEP